ncbi:MAG: peptidase Ste24p [Gammaproteobacteria bacterium]|jgi:predicted Zn-dependent protease|nr:peptidase Ste24p [Gammaproteobacteria bacterium]
MTRLYFVFLLCLLFSPLSYANTELPDLGNPTADYISPAEIREYGQQFLNALHSQFKVIDDPLIDSYIHDLGFRLVGSTNHGNGLHFEFLVVDTPVINAMTGPNGIIAIASGLILAADNENELAGVLAHEIAHVTQGHFAAGYAYSKKMTPISIGLMLAALAVATQNSQAGGGAVAATAAGSAATTLKVQRSYEQEADRIGLQILAAARFDPVGLLDFFLKLQSDARYYGAAPGFLSDHPLNTDRIADLGNRIKSLPPQQKKSNVRYRLIKERIRVMSVNKASDLLQYYQRKMKESNDPAEKTALEYGYTLALLESRQFKEGESRLNSLQKAYPNDITYVASLAQVYLEDNKPEQALLLLKPAIDLNPDYYPLVITYAIALEEAKHYSEAVRYLRDQLPQFSTYPLMYLILAKAQAGNQQIADAYQNRAKAFLLVGNTQGALQQLRTAAQLPKLSPNQQEAINAEIKRLTAAPEK